MSEKKNRPDDKASPKTHWVKALEKDALPEGRVQSVTCEGRGLCMTHHQGKLGALDNRCPHQGGPLGEGSIEKGLLRCPWHGWDYDPLTGKAPGFDDGVESFPTEEREDGVYVQLPLPEAHERSVSDQMMETMVAWGLKQVFGMVGHSNLGLADAVRRQVQAGALSYYGIRHEGAAAFAASAYGKLTRRPAACLTIAGPGATNLLTGLWDANVDRAPVLALTGQVNTQVLGPGAFQEVDLQAAYGKVAQWSQPVLHGSRHSELVNLAFKSALLNRGVSHLIFPDEVQILPAGDAPAGGPAGRLPDQRIAPPKAVLEEAIKKLSAAKRPLIIAGHGARAHRKAIAALAEQLGAPVVTTFKGKGLIPDTHPLAAGVLGRSGTPIASHFMNESDLLLVLGASFSNHTGISPKKPIIQIDLDPMILGKFHAVELPVLGELGTSVAALSAGLPEHGLAPDPTEELAKRWKIWRSEKASRRRDDQRKGLASATIFEALSQAVPANAILTVDVGNNAYAFGRYFECQDQEVLMSGYLGSIGFALPAAIGAYAATQEPGTEFSGRKVVSVSGDAGLGQYLSELTTLAKYKMNITHVLLTNDELGKISKEQRAAGFEVWETSLKNPSFTEVATSCGVFAKSVHSPDALASTLAEALAHPGPSLVEIFADVALI